MSFYTGDFVGIGMTRVRQRSSTITISQNIIRLKAMTPSTSAKTSSGMNGDLVPPGERCASTTNRNFKGRQGPGSRTHLTAAAVTGRLTDARGFIPGA